MRLGLALIAILTLLPVSVVARIWHVPSQVYPIQDAIDSAAVGDTVLIAPGIYRDNGNRDLTLSSNHQMGQKQLSLNVMEAGQTHTVVSRSFTTRVRRR